MSDDEMLKELQKPIQRWSLVNGEMVADSGGPYVVYAQIAPMMQALAAMNDKLIDKLLAIKAKPEALQTPFKDAVALAPKGKSKKASKAPKR